MNLGLSPVFAFIFQPFFYQNDKTKRQDRFFCLAFLLLFAYMLFIIFSNKTSVDVVSYFSMFVSVVFVILGSCFLSVSTIYAKRLSDLGFNPIETLAVRFFILVIFSGLISLVDHQSLLLPSHQITGVIKLSFLYAIIPLYFAQVSIRKIRARLAFFAFLFFLFSSLEKRQKKRAWHKLCGTNYANYTTLRYYLALPFF